MRKETLFTVIAGIAVTAGIIWFMSGLGNNEAPTDPSTNQQPTQQNTVAEESNTLTPEEAREEAQQREAEVQQQAEESSRYVDYTPEVFAASTTPNNVISFDATWCYVCDAIEENILNGEIPSDLTIFKADFDTEIELRKKYGVTTQTTFVQVTPSGDEITKWVMYDVNAGIDEIVAKLQ